MHHNTIVLKLIAMALQSIKTWFYFIDAFRQLNNTAYAGKWSLRLPYTFFYFKDVVVYLPESSYASQLVSIVSITAYVWFIIMN
jgi:hypothetical protein